MRGYSRQAVRVVTVAALVALTTVVGSPSASAAITSQNATGITTALRAATTGTTTASFVTVPPDGTPNGVGNSPLAGFPTEGSTFGILTTGDVNFADDANTEPNTTADDHGDNGDVARGNTDFDVSVLKIDFTAAAGMNCIRFDFRFFSEEFEEFVGSDFNDAFIAELDTSDWTTSTNDIMAPHNFAFDPAGKEISINAAGNTSMTGDPNGTTYDGATPVLTAAHTVTPGPHSLYLSIFDQGDHRFDSAVFLDNFVIGHAPNPDVQCAPGAAPKRFDLALAPPTATHAVGDTHTVTATLTDLDDGPIAGGHLLFTVAGANTAAGTVTTTAGGTAAFTYTGTATGTDTITACYDVNANGTCDKDEPIATVSATWTAAGPTSTPTPTPPPGNGGGNGGLAVTGGPTALIAGVGLVALALGLIGYVVIRRRRVRFTAE